MRQKRNTVLGTGWMATVVVTLGLGGAGLSPLAAQSPQLPLNTLSAEEEERGWILLFDGESLAGWQAGSEVDWRVVNGAIVAATGELGLLHTTREFADFELKLDFRAARGTNSGVFLRSLPQPSDVLTDCYELNIAPPDNPFPTGSFVGRKKVEGAGETEAWRTYEVVARGGEFRVRLDGTLILELHDPQPIRRGVLGLQFNQGRIEFRNVKIRSL